MSTAATFNGSSFTIPAVGDRRWGQNVTNLLISLAGNALAKSGGNFTLTADVNFGANFGVTSKYFKSVTSNISTTGIIRLANNEGIGFRNAANSADFILKVNASNVLEFDGVALSTAASAVTLTGTQTLTNKTLTSPVINTPTGIVKGDVGLGNVDNTSDATKNTATATLTNKTLTGVAGITLNSGATIDFASGATSIGASVGINPLTVGGAGTSVVVPGILKPSILAVDADSIVLNNDAVASGADWKGTITRPSSGMLANATYTLPLTTDTLVGRATTDTLTNKTLTSPVLVTPALGTPASGVATNLTGIPLGTDASLTGTLSIAKGGTGQTAKAAAFDALSPNTTKGDITARTSSTNDRLAVGADGTVLTASSAAATGLAWTAPLTNPMSAVGDLIVGGASGAATRLAPNTTTTRKWLTQTGTGSVGQAQVWDDPVATSTTKGLGQATASLGLVHVGTQNGNGSTNTTVRRWSNIITNSGTDITYADSATAGATFTINVSGIYAMSYTDLQNIGGNQGITLNNNSPGTTNVAGVSASLVLTLMTSTTGEVCCNSSITRYLAAGDVIRTQTDGGTNSPSVARAHFSIQRIS